MHNEVHGFALTSSKKFLGVMEYGRRYRDIPDCSYVLLLDLDRKPLDWIFKKQSTRALHCLGCTKMNFGNDSFSLARGLRVLELHDESSLQKLPESICQLRQLGYLKLSGWSGLVTLPESIGGLINLLHIDLSSCSGLIHLPGSFGKLINLVHISLSGCCKLENLPESFGKLIKLVHINLSGSSALVHLPEFFGKLINLVHINLSGCLALANLPESIGELTKLEHINLSGCQALVDFPESFRKLTKLEHINISGCHKLVNLPGSFGKLTSLLHVNLSSCYGLSKLPQSFGKLTNLAHINLSGCSVIKKLPQSFCKLISLVHINLSNCSGLATLPEAFGDLQNLLHVDLSRCYGLELPKSFGKLKKLLHLDLSFRSCFEGMQTILGGLTGLKHLNLSHPCCRRADYPHLKGLKQVLGQFVRLEHLNLSMFLNPIFCDQSQKENLEYIKLISGLSTLKYLDLSHNIFLRDLPESLNGLERLHTLDLSGCIRLKKVNEWRTHMPSSLKSLVLSNMESYQFVVGHEDVINNYNQLVDVRCKELKITRLQNMKSTAEPRRIKLAKKQNLQKLLLSWNVRSRRTMEDDALLGELVPPHSLRCLELKGYSSTCFPSWLRSSSISSFNLVEVTMEDIPKCRDLPPLGLLPNLQRVVLRRMARITRIHAGDLSGGNTAAFNRLSKFIIEDMGSLEEFTYYGGGGVAFPVIDELVVKKCPTLSFVPFPPRARRAGRHGVEGLSCISTPVTWVTELMETLPEELGNLSSLQELLIESCGRFRGLPNKMKHLAALQSMHFTECNSMTELPLWLGNLTSLQKLAIERCMNIESLPPSIGELTNLKDLHIVSCSDLKWWCEKDENKKHLSHIRPKIEEAPTSVAGDHLRKSQNMALTKSQKMTHTRIY
uniref:Protein popC n=1 Tax=Aegilops tauschii TaxID=37682 RepID=M8BDZ9_AEGTA